MRTSDTYPSRIDPLAVGNGPDRTFKSAASAALRLLRTGHSCVSQHFERPEVRCADKPAVDLDDQFVRYRARAMRHADGDAPNLPWKALLKASCEA